MKLRVLTVMAALVVFMATPSFAQVNFSAGVKGGVNFAKLAFDPEEEECCDMRTGFIGGLFVVAPISETVAIQPEFLYSMQGAKFDFGDGFESEVQLDYFQVPILVRADFATGGGVRPFVLFGPTIGFNVKAKDKFEDDEEDIKDDVKNVDIGFAIGGGLQFGAASVEARYTHGLTNANDDSDDEGIREL